MSDETQIELHDGFQVEAREDDPGALEALKRDWARLRPMLADEALALESNYREGNPTERLPDGVWRAMEAPRVRCRAPGRYELSCRFTWQASEDPHRVTFYVEDGETRGCTFDD